MSKADFERLAEFRYQLRRFLQFSEEVTHRNGVIRIWNRGAAAVFGSSAVETVGSRLDISNISERDRPFETAFPRASAPRAWSPLRGVRASLGVQLLE